MANDNAGKAFSVKAGDQLAEALTRYAKTMGHPELCAFYSPGTGATPQGFVMMDDVKPRRTGLTLAEAETYIDARAGKTISDYLKERAQRRKERSHRERTKVRCPGDSPIDTRKH